MRGELVVPSEQELLHAFGVESTAIGTEDHVRQFTVATDDTVVVSYDVVGRSVRVRWIRRGSVRADVLREGATRLSVGIDRVTAAFETGELRGELVVVVYPEVMITDVMLIT